MVSGIKIGRENPKYSEKFASFLHFVNRKSHTDYTGIELVPLQWETAGYTAW
jgi:hypothetical protein